MQVPLRAMRALNVLNLLISATCDYWLKVSINTVLERCRPLVRLDASRSLSTASSFNQRLLQHSPPYPSCSPTNASATRDDVTITSYSGIPGGCSYSAAVVAAYHQSRAPLVDADWSTRRLPVSHVGVADRRHLQQLELGNNNCDVQKSPQKDSAIADGK